MREPILLAAEKGSIKDLCALLDGNPSLISFVDNKGRRPLHVASTYGQTECVAELLSRGADITARTEDGATALHFACHGGWPIVGKALLEAGAPVDAIDTLHGMPPLHVLAGSKSPNTELAAALLAHGARIDAADKAQRTALHMAVEAKNADMVAWLLDQHANGMCRDSMGVTPLHMAAERGALKIVDTLIRSDMDPSAVTKSGRSPLMLALINGHAEVARLLLDGGADVTCQDKNGVTALHLAADRAALHVLPLLLERGSNFAAMDKLGRTPMHLAVIRGNVDAVRLLISRGASVHVTDQNGISALHLAAEAGHLEIAEMLLDRGASINGIDTLSHTPLHRAVGKGHRLMAELLIKCGANVDIADEEGLSPLLWACTSGDASLVKLLMSRGADVHDFDKNGATALHHAAELGHAGLVSFLIQEGLALDHPDKTGRHPLHRAASRGQLAVTRILLVKGAPVNAADKDLALPLHLALVRKAGDLAMLLLEHGSKPDAPDVNGVTPLHLASLNRLPQVVTALLKKEVPVNAVDKNRCTPLHLAAHRGVEETARLLLQEGADADAKDAEDDTPLRLAALGRHDGIVKLLLEAGANPLLPNKLGVPIVHSVAEKGLPETLMLLLAGMKDLEVDAPTKNKQTPLHYACFGGHASVAKVLLELGADVAAADAEGGTPLHVASVAGHVDVLRLLVTAAAPLEARDKAGHTPLHLAVTNGNPEAVRVLLEAGADVKATSTFGASALHWAAAKGLLPVVELLLAKGADIDAADARTQTSLHMAVIEGSEEGVHLLLVRGADGSALDKYGRTPLHWAAQKGDLTLVKLLVERATETADASKQVHAVNHRDLDASTPLHLAASAGHLEVVRFLVSQGGDLRLEDKNEQNPLRRAAEGGHVEVACYLLEADPSADLCRPSGQAGWTEAEWAAVLGLEANILKYLQQGGSANARGKIGIGQLFFSTEAEMFLVGILYSLCLFVLSKQQLFLPPPSYSNSHHRHLPPPCPCRATAMFPGALQMERSGEPGGAAGTCVWAHITQPVGTGGQPAVVTLQIIRTATDLRSLPTPGAPVVLLFFSTREAYGHELRISRALEPKGLVLPLLEHFEDASYDKKSPYVIVRAWQGRLLEEVLYGDHHRRESALRLLDDSDHSHGGRGWAASLSDRRARRSQRETNGDMPTPIRLNFGSNGPDPLDVTGHAAGPAGAEPGRVEVSEEQEGREWRLMKGIVTAVVQLQTEGLIHPNVCPRTLIQTSTGWSFLYVGSCVASGSPMEASGMSPCYMPYEMAKARTENKPCLPMPQYNTWQIGLILYEVIKKGRRFIDNVPFLAPSGVREVEELLLLKMTRAVDRDLHAIIEKLPRHSFSAATIALMLRRMIQRDAARRPLPLQLLQNAYFSEPDELEVKAAELEEAATLGTPRVAEGAAAGPSHQESGAEPPAAREPSFANSRTTSGLDMAPPRLPAQVREATYGSDEDKEWRTIKRRLSNLYRDQSGAISEISLWSGAISDESLYSEFEGGGHPAFAPVKTPRAGKEKEKKKKCMPHCIIC
eukprot:jgi/Mesvir1/17648/Mv08866-RA.1